MNYGHIAVALEIGAYKKLLNDFAEDDLVMYHVREADCHQIEDVFILEWQETRWSVAWGKIFDFVEKYHGDYVRLGDELTDIEFYCGLSVLGITRKIELEV